MTESNNKRKTQFLSLVATPSIDYPVNSVLQGKLPKNKKIKGDLPIVIDFEDGEYIVSEPKFHIHGSGMTRDQALLAFTRILSEIYDELVEESDHLGKRMKEQFDYLQTKIETVN